MLLVFRFTDEPATKHIFENTKYNSIITKSLISKLPFSDILSKKLLKNNSKYRIDEPHYINNYSFQRTLT